MALSDLRGQVVLVNLWATWCGPCRFETPFLQSLYEEYGERGFEIVGISVDDAGFEDGVREFTGEYGVTYTILHDPEMRSMDAFRAVGLPATYLLDRDGTIRLVRIGPVSEEDGEFFDALEAALEVSGLPAGLADAETPVALVDVARARANAARVAAYASRHGIAWRPHVKTHKSLALARIQLDAGARGLTVATPHEAEVMARACDDLLLAYPPLGTRKLARLMALPERVALTVALDSDVALRGLGRAAQAAGRTVGVLVEVDVGLGRMGVGDAREAARLATIARDAPSLRYRGIMFYPGHIRTHVADQRRAIAALAEQLESLCAALAEADLAPEVVSGGSSPTLWHSHLLPGLTEVRAGTVVYNDLDMTGMGVAREHECAYSILATVVSTAVPGRAVVDAGSKALSKELHDTAGPGYAAVAAHPNVRVVALSEEHGVLDLSGTDWRPRVGELVRLLPNHVCVSVNLQDRVVAHDGGRWETWPIEGRGRVASWNPIVESNLEPALNQKPHPTTESDTP